MHVYFEEKYQELANKYETTMKDKMTLKVEKERLLVKVKALENGTVSLQEKLREALQSRRENSFEQTGLDNTVLLEKSKQKISGRNKDNTNKENQESSGSIKRNSKRGKKNPALTPISKILSNPYVNAETGLVLDMKPVFSSNLNHLKKIQVAKLSILCTSE